MNQSSKIQNPSSNIQHRPSSIQNPSSNIQHPKSNIQESLGFRNWFAIYVKSRHEKSVHAELQQKGIESSLPLMTVTRQWSDRRKKVEVPLFRGYVFVKIDISKEKFDVLQTDGVVKFVTFNNVTVPIPEDQMYWLQQMINSDLLLSQEQDFPVGAEVNVMFGPLKGLKGRVKQKNSKSRLVVWFDAIMQGVSVEIDPTWITPVRLQKNVGAIAHV